MPWETHHSWDSPLCILYPICHEKSLLMFTGDNVYVCLVGKNTYPHVEALWVSFRKESPRSHGLAEDWAFRHSPVIFERLSAFQRKITVTWTSLHSQQMGNIFLEKKKITHDFGCARTSACQTRTLGQKILGNEILWTPNSSKCQRNKNEQFTCDVSPVSLAYYMR